MFPEDDVVFDYGFHVLGYHLKFCSVESVVFQFFTCVLEYVKFFFIGFENFVVEFVCLLDVELSWFWFL